MHTQKIHGYYKGNIRLLMPVLKRVNDLNVLSGTFFYPIRRNNRTIVAAHPINKRWLSITDEQVAIIIDAMTSENTEGVWVHDRLGLEYPATLIQLPNDVAEELHLNHQIRIQKDEVVGRNEICVSDEIFADRFLEERGIHRKKIPFSMPFDVIPLEKAVSIIRDKNGLPQPHSYPLSVPDDPAFAHMQEIA